MFVNLDRLEQYRNTLPYFVYQRLTIGGAVTYFIETLPYGYWYWLRRIHCHYPEQTDAPAWLADLRFEIWEQASNKWPQNVALPFRLVTTQNSGGVTITVGGELTATVLKYAKQLNVVHPFRDTLNIQITAQAGTAPTFIDVVTMGYLIPVNELDYWDDSPGVKGASYPTL